MLQCILQLREFIMFEKNLIELSSFASNLPQDACETKPIIIENGTSAYPPLNTTQSPLEGVTQEGVINDDGEESKTGGPKVIF